MPPRHFWRPAWRRISRTRCGARRNRWIQAPRPRKWKRWRNSAAVEHVLGELLHVVHQQVRWILYERFGLEPVGHAASQHLRVASGANIHAAVADHDGVLLAGAAFFHQRPDADGIRLLLFETVSAVDAKKMRAQAQPV